MAWWSFCVEWCIVTNYIDIKTWNTIACNNIQVDNL